MPTNCKLTATFVTSSGLPEDYVVNTWHFRWVGLGAPGDLNNPLDMIDDFYFAQAPGNTVTLASRYPQATFTGTCFLKLYDLSDPEPRTPIAERTKTNFNRSSNEPLPREVALVMSFQSAQQSGIPQRRRRNRVYLGPFSEADNDTNGRPALTLRNVIRNCGKELLNESAASLNWNWQIMSQFYAQDNVPVDNGWVDNQWDTQRRRGPKSTERGIFNSTTP